MIKVNTTAIFMEVKQASLENALCEKTQGNFKIMCLTLWYPHNVHSNHVKPTEAINRRHY